jgi:hypothetical protein
VPNRFTQTGIADGEPAQRQKYLKRRNKFFDSRSTEGPDRVAGAGLAGTARIAIKDHTGGTCSHLLQD